MKITLKSSDVVHPAPPPARVWTGHSEDGVPVTAFLTIVADALRGAPPDVVERTRKALETHVVSFAEILIPEPGRPRPEGLIAREWETYRERVLPAKAAPVQVLETKRAFYAGAWALHMLLMTELSPGPDVRDEDEAALGDIHEELAAFGASGGLEE